MDDKVKQTLGKVFNDLADALEDRQFIHQQVKVGVTLFGSEQGIQNVIRGAEMAQSKDPSLDVRVIGSSADTHLTGYEAHSEEEQYHRMEKLIDEGEIHCAVTMHYPFPIGVSTVGKVITPGKGKEMFIATTTGTTSTNRAAGMVINAISGIITAKAMGIKNPSLGILNVDGARPVERALKKLKSRGYEIQFAESIRENRDLVMRGNDLLTGTPDVMVTDTLTGNLLMKIFSSYTTGGNYESLGYGYGPGVGEGYQRCILIVSRTSGEPVIRNAISFAGKLIRGNLLAISKAEFAKAHQAGLKEILRDIKTESQEKTLEGDRIPIPPKEVVTKSILGIDIMDLEDAVKILWQNNIYAESGMGCTGPIVMVSNEKYEASIKVLINAEYIE